MQNKYLHFTLASSGYMKDTLSCSNYTQMREEKLKLPSFLQIKI